MKENPGFACRFRRAHAGRKNDLGISSSGGAAPRRLPLATFSPSLRDGIHNARNSVSYLASISRKVKSKN